MSEEFLREDERASVLARILQLDRRVYAFLQSGCAEDWLGVDLTMPQLKVLLLVGFSGTSLTASQIARGLGVTLSTITGIVDRLCDQGVVRRGEDAHDRRITLVAMTPGGQRLVDRLYGAGRARTARLLDHLSLDELHTVERALDLMHDAVLAEQRERNSGLPPVPLTEPTVTAANESLV